MSYWIHRDSLGLKIARRAGRYAQRIAYSDAELVVSLSNSLKLREVEIAERGSLQGKLLALFLGKDSGETIEVDGARLKHLVELSGVAPRDHIDLNQIYAVRLAAFRELLDRAEQAIGNRS